MKYNFSYLRNPEGEVSSGGSGGGTPVAPTPSTPNNNDAKDMFGSSSDSADPGRGSSVSTSPTVAPSVAGVEAARGSRSDASAASEQKPPTVQQPLSQTSPQFPTPPAQQFTPQQIAELAAQTATRTVGALQPQQAQVEPQFTDADFNKAFNIPTVDANTFTAITGYAPDKPEQVKALNDFAMGVIRAAVTMSNFQLEQARQQVSQQMSPILQAQQSQQESALSQEFFTTNSHLKDFEPLIAEVAKGFARDGVKFNSKTELFKAVADQTTRLLGRAGQSTNAGNPAQNTPNGVPPAANGSSHIMTPAALATGGQVSASHGSAARVGDAKSIFG